MPFCATRKPLEVGAVSRDSIGGHPFLPAGVPWPTHDSQRMVLFFQLDVRAEFGLSLAPGTHLAVFMSAEMNEIPGTDFVKNGAPLPDRFWEKRSPHFKAFVFEPGIELVPHRDADAFLQPQRLDFAFEESPEDPFFIVGGTPVWYQGEELHPSFDFVCQLSEDYGFPKRPGAASQPDSFSRNQYCLFLGNSVYFFARARPQHSEEVWVVVQN